MSEFLTSVQIFANAPVDPTLTDVCMVPSRGAWESALQQYQINAVEQCTYQRDRGVIRYPAAYPALSHANYCSFYNNAHQGLLGQVYRWYAFITKVTYVNDNLTELEIKVDPFHTYQTEISASLGNAYIDRMHTNTDEPGDNTLDDGIAVGDYVTQSIGTLDFSSDLTIIIGSTKVLPAGDVDVGGTLIDGVYSGVNLYAWRASDAATVRDMIYNLASTGKAGCIQFMYMIPSAFVTLVGNTPVTNGNPLTLSASNKFPQAVDGYTPRNKKLLTYPYCAMTVSNNAGNAGTFRYELFSSDNIQFIGFASIAPGGGMLLYPRNYAGQTNAKEYGIILGNYPQCSWQSGNFNTWLATQGLRQEVSGQQNFTNALVNMGVQAGTWNGLGVAQSLMSYLQATQSMEVERRIASLTPPEVSGRVGGDLVNMANGQYGYTLANRCIRAEVAQTIDSYYDLYGYPIRKIQLLTMQASPRKWRYVRTIGYRLRSNVPQPYSLEVENAFNNGVRFWAKPDEFLDYSLDNSPA